jgi:hypothetical protein
MSVKWKIFFALNFIIGLPALVLLVRLGFLIWETRNPLDQYAMGYVVFAGLLFVTLNSFWNIFLLQRCYPDRALTGTQRGWNIFFLVINWLVELGLLIVTIVGIGEEFGSDASSGSDVGKIVLGILVLVIAAMASQLIMQAQLPRLISRNIQNKMSSLIESIGDNGTNSEF